MRALTAFTILVRATGARAQTAPAPIVVYAAGSAKGALGAMLGRYTAETGVKVDLHTGPAGLLLQGIEQGERWRWLPAEPTEERGSLAIIML